MNKTPASAPKFAETQNMQGSTQGQGPGSRYAEGTRGPTPGLTQGSRSIHRLFRAFMRCFSVEVVVRRVYSVFVPRVYRLATSM